MDTVNLSPANQTIIQKQQVATQPKVETKTEEKKDNKKLLIAGAAAAAALAIAGIAIYKGKNTTKLQDIKFDKGIAKKNDELFTGVVKDKLKNGDKVTLEYVDGVIKKSSIKGSKTLEKTFETNDAGHKIVKTIENGKEKVFDITQRQDEVKLDQKKLNKLLNDKTLSSEELSKQSDEIIFKNNKQKEEIKKAVEDKKVLEAKEKAIKEAQEKAAKEVEEKAAEESARAIIELKRAEKVKDEGNFTQRLEYIKDLYDDEYSNYRLSNKKLGEFLEKEVPREYIEAMSNTFIDNLYAQYSEEKIIKNFRKLIAGEDFDMTPEKLKKITNGDASSRAALEGYLTGGYTDKERVQLIELIKQALNKK